MNARTKILSIAFFITGILCIFFGNSATFIPGFIAKTFLIPLLFILITVNIRSPFVRSDKLMVAALFFYWAGDIVIEFNGYFIPGLGCFLLAHVMYLTLFFSTPGKNIIFRDRWYLLLPLIISGALFIGYLYNDIGDMLIPVVIYSIAILTMLAGAINRFGKVNRTSYFLVLAGAILFVMSDSAIAINKFSYHFESSGMVVMTTYIIAQYLIVMGYINQRSGNFS